MHQLAVIVQRFLQATAGRVDDGRNTMFFKDAEEDVGFLFRFRVAHTAKGDQQEFGVFFNKFQ